MKLEWTKLDELKSKLTALELQKAGVVAEMEDTLKQIREMQEQAVDVPLRLDFEFGGKCYCELAGKPSEQTYDDLSIYAAQEHRLFKNYEFASLYCEKTQAVADMLHFKWLYDKDFVPDFTDNEGKYYIIDRGDKFVVVVTYGQKIPSAVYFSSAEIAKKCAEWMDAQKYGYNKCCLG